MKKFGRLFLILGCPGAEVSKAHREARTKSKPKPFFSFDGFPIDMTCPIDDITCLINDIAWPNDEITCHSYWIT